VSDCRRSAAASYSSLGNPSFSNPPSRWWVFTLPISRGDPPPNPPGDLPRQCSERENSRRPTISFRDRSMSWLNTTHLRRTQDANSYGQAQQEDRQNEQAHDWNLHVNIPTPLPLFTAAHSQTPGWDVPWAPRTTASPRVSFIGNGIVGGEENHSNSRPSRWWKGKKQLRSSVLNNNYVPLV